MASPAQIAAARGGRQLLLGRRSFGASPAVRERAAGDASEGPAACALPAQPVGPSSPTFAVWGCNTGVGKSLVSAGLAAAAVRSGVRRKLAVLSHPRGSSLGETLRPASRPVRRRADARAVHQACADGIP